MEEIMSKVVSIPEVDGAALVRSDSSVITCCTKNGIKPEYYKDFMSTTFQSNIHSYKDGIFNEYMRSHNGHKILVSKVREDVMLLLVLDKKAYLGLIMLDMECCLREIDDELNEHIMLACENPG
jgi:predicted regulator of Ras-like GTPase activity (Roadblock/LC7/MglB family)